MPDFNAWYDKNKESYNAKRREKYARDKEYNKARKAAVKRTYWLKKRRAVNLSASRISLDEKKANGLTPDELITLEITDPNDFRCGYKVQIPAYHTSTVGALLGRTDQTMRLWYVQKYLPEALYRNKKGYRLITEDQLRVILDNREYLAFTTKDFAVSPFFTNIAYGFEQLNADGIAFMEGDLRVDPQQCPKCGNSPTVQEKDVFGKWQFHSCPKCDGNAVILL